MYVFETMRKKTFFFSRIIKHVHMNLCLAMLHRVFHRGRVIGTILIQILMILILLLKEACEETEALPSYQQLMGRI